MEVKVISHGVGHQPSRGVPCPLHISCAFLSLLSKGRWLLPHLLLMLLCLTLSSVNQLSLGLKPHHPRSQATTISSTSRKKRKNGDLRGSLHI
ncbi:unnamed protein product [Cuscuta campestris]|uniref:Uncharacterized protein n=1 Tax=Cuscuta campestris TaxID=132261 RepID=A0A484LTF5_9ASTE|nr:unnamed protein product [Cuscuta campestris]